MYLIVFQHKMYYQNDTPKPVHRSTGRLMMMSEVDDLILKAKSRDHNDDEEYWDNLVEDIMAFRSGNHPEEEKRRLGPLGPLEIALMMSSAIKSKKERNNGKG